MRTARPQRQPGVVVVRLTGPASPAVVDTVAEQVRRAWAAGLEVHCLVSDADLAVVDLLARLTVEARRDGRVLTVSGGEDLLAVCGLSGQVGRQAEAGEQPGVEEVVDVPDGAA